MKLNEMQKKVVYSDERFLFLLAGAGSGKTRVVIEKIKYLLSKDVQTDDILALTFTNKAANEMKKRIGRDDMRIHTFHQFCYQELKKHCNYTYKIFEETLTTEFTKKDLLEISVYKNSLYRKQKPKKYDLYQNYLLIYQYKDFDDLLIDFLTYIKLYKTFHFKYIFVDEFQDTNELQYQILKQLIQKQTHCLCVGDPDQSIYQFRGANPSIIHKYIKDFDANIKTLTINYRSNETIVSHANRLIKRNYRKYKKELVSYNKQTKHILSYLFMDYDEEANFIMNQISMWIKQGIKAHNIAILYRQHHRAYHLVDTFKRHEVYYYQDQVKLYEQSVSVISVHQAKGLEFDAVIILGLEANMFPSHKTDQHLFLEEERRLMFVAITRAKEHLIYTHIKYNDYFQRQKPSLFIRESGLKSKVYKYNNDI